MNLFLDIETIGCTDETVCAEIAAGITAPKSMSKPETIARWEAEEKPAAVAKAIADTSFDGGLGHVVCIGFAIVDKGIAAAVVERVDEEATLLRDTFAAIAETLANAKPVQVIGHNVAWDVRFLWQRCIVLQVAPPDWLRAAVRAKPWDMADTMTLWNPERDRKISLDRLCRILRVESPKADLDGSRVWEFFKAGKLREIADYCRGDVAAMRECYRRMTA